MSLIAIACYDTEENNRTWMTEKTLISLAATVNLDKHDLYVIDNASCQATKDLLKKMQNGMRFQLITNEENLGTAKAINQAWRFRKSGQHCIKMDNDVVIHQNGWVEQMEEVIERGHMIGQVALKRIDLWESQYNENPSYRTELVMLKPIPGKERWLVVEDTKHCIGTCVMHSSALIDTVGFLVQPKIYGLDDSIMSHRSKIAGFNNCFLPHIPIDHIDTGSEIAYMQQKRDIAGESMAEYNRLLNGYRDGSIPVYYNPFE